MTSNYPAAILSNFDGDLRGAYEHLSKGYLALEKQFADVWSSRYAAKRADSLATQWPNCEMVFVRQHTADKLRGDGASRFVVLHKMTLDFRASLTEVSR